MRTIAVHLAIATYMSASVDHKETDAAYILDLPALVHFWGEEQLEYVPEKLPSLDR